MSFSGLIQKIKDRDCEFVDFFPLNDRMFTPKNMAMVIGIYIGIIIFVAALIVVLGSVFILGVILKIIGAIAVIYSVIGIVGFMLTFMKYN
ncbi:MAG: hypothetical protein ACI4I6_10410 [Hominimerdicola sp.]